MLICRVCENPVEKFANGSRCKSCYNEYMRVYMLNRYHKQRAKIVAIMGGLCSVCGSSSNLEIDHVDRDTKAFDIGHSWSKTDEELRIELSKCQLLCEKHHAEKTAEENSVDHGEGLTGKKNCRCERCARLKNAYTASWRKQNGRKKAPMGR